MAKGNYVVIALFVFDDGFPIFNTFIGVTCFGNEAFNMIKNYNYKKIIADGYEMDIDETDDLLKEFGTDGLTGKVYYEERHKFTYQLKGMTKKGTVSVTFTIYET